MNTYVVTLYDVLIVSIIFLIWWLLPIVANYLNTKSRFLHELYIEQLQANKKRYPELYIPFFQKFKNFMRRLFK